MIPVSTAVLVTLNAELEAAGEALKANGAEPDVSLAVEHIERARLIILAHLNLTKDDLR